MIATLLALAVGFGPPHPIQGSIDLNGTLLDYVTEGSGTPCLVIGSSVYYPRTFSVGLRRHFRFTFVDMRWFAKRYSTVSVSSYTMETLMEDIDRVRRSLGLGKFVLMGHSIHGSIAFEYARRHPEHIARLVLIGSPAVLGSPEYEGLAAQLWETASPERQRLQAQNWRAQGAGKTFSSIARAVADYLAMAPKYWFNPRYDASWLWNGMTVHGELLAHIYQGFFANYQMFRNGRVAPVPTLVVQGKYDYVVPHTQWDALLPIANLTVSLFDKSGHTPQLEEPGRFDDLLVGWSKAVDRSSWSSFARMNAL